MKLPYTMLWLLVPTLLLAPVASAQTRVEILQERLKLELTQLDADQIDTKDDIDKTYILALDKLHGFERQSGNLEGVTAIRYELERFGKSLNPATTGQESSHPKVRQLQQQYAQQIREQEKKWAEKILTLANQYTSSLSRLQKVLVSENQIQEAQRVQDEIKLIEGHDLLKTARATLKKPIPRVTANVPPTAPAAIRNFTQAGVDGVAKDLKYNKDIAAWREEGTALSAFHPGTKIRLSPTPPSRNWKVPGVELKDPKRSYGFFTLGHGTKVNVVQEVGKYGGIYGWFSFGEDVDFTSKRTMTFAIPGNKRREAEPQLQHFEFPVLYKEVLPHYHAAEIDMTPGWLTHRSACVMEGLVTLGGGVHEIALADRDGDAAYADTRTTRVMVKNNFTGKVVTALPGYPFEVGGAYYELNKIADHGQSVSFKRCEHVLLTGRITDAQTGKALEGAVVTIPALNRQIPTAIEGIISTEIPHGSYEGIFVSYPGYIPTFYSEQTRIPHFRTFQEQPNDLRLSLRKATAEPLGTITIGPNQSYHFLAGQLGEPEQGDFSVTVLPNQKNGLHFQTSGPRQLGIALIGVLRTELTQIDPSLYEFKKGLVPAIEGQTYIARARLGEFASFIVFKVKRISPAQQVTLDYAYLRIVPK